MTAASGSKPTASAGSRPAPSTIRTRRYHALLLAATTPPTGRMVLVNGFDAWVDTPAAPLALTTAALRAGRRPSRRRDRGIATFDARAVAALDVRARRRHARRAGDLRARTARRPSRWRWRLPTGTRPAATPVTLASGFLSGRDYHALHHENPAFRLRRRPATRERLRWQPVRGLPAIDVAVERRLRARARLVPALPLHRGSASAGSTAIEDLASPGRRSGSISPPARRC